MFCHLQRSFLSKFLFYKMRLYYLESEKWQLKWQQKYRKNKCFNYFILRILSIWVSSSYHIKFYYKTKPSHSFNNLISFWDNNGKRIHNSISWLFREVLYVSNYPYKLFSKNKRCLIIREAAFFFFYIWLNTTRTCIRLEKEQYIN